MNASQDLAKNLYCYNIVDGNLSANNSLKIRTIYNILSKITVKLVKIVNDVYINFNNYPFFVQNITSSASIWSPYTVKRGKGAGLEEESFLSRIPQYFPTEVRTVLINKIIS